MTREEAIAFFKDMNECTYGNLDAVEMAIKALEQEPKTGHWISGKYKDTCSRCRCTYPKNIGFKNYCPNCGARMVEPQESEDNNVSI